MLIASLQAVVSVPFLAAGLRAAHGGELQPLGTRDPLAKNLGYHNDVGGIDAEAFPEFAADRTCANCNLFQGAEGDATGGCAIFPGKSVVAGGWCKVWAP